MTCVKVKAKPEGFIVGNGEGGALVGLATGGRVGEELLVPVELLPLPPTAEPTGARIGEAGELSPADARVGEPTACCVPAGLVVGRLMGTMLGFRKKLMAVEDGDADPQRMTDGAPPPPAGAVDRPIVGTVVGLCVSQRAFRDVLVSEDERSIAKERKKKRWLMNANRSSPHLADLGMVGAEVGLNMILRIDDMAVGLAVGLAVGRRVRISSGARQVTPVLRVHEAVPVQRAGQVLTPLGARH